MKDSDKLFDVIAVDIKTKAVRIMAADMEIDNAEAFVSMAVVRRGVDKEFFAPRPAGSYKEGDKYAG